MGWVGREERKAHPLNIQNFDTKDQARKPPKLPSVFWWLLTAVWGSMEHFRAITGKQHTAGQILISVAKISISYFQKQKHK